MKDMRFGVPGKQRISVGIFSVGDGDDERFRGNEILPFIGFGVFIQKVVRTFLNSFLFARLTFLSATC